MLNEPTRALATDLYQTEIDFGFYKFILMQGLLQGELNAKTNLFLFESIGIVD